MSEHCLVAEDEWVPCPEAPPKLAKREDPYGEQFGAHLAACVCNGTGRVESTVERTIYVFQLRGAWMAYEMNTYGKTGFHEGPTEDEAIAAAREAPR